ncbi:MAG: hemolysin family protein [Planctomycetes bacterium]|nr:hemolysin family protein [Planctomycetota bacterium]
MDKFRQSDDEPPSRPKSSIEAAAALPLIFEDNYIVLYFVLAATVFLSASLWEGALAYLSKSRSLSFFPEAYRPRLDRHLNRLRTYLLLARFWGIVGLTMILIPRLIYAEAISLPLTIVLATVCVLLSPLMYLIGRKFTEPVLIYSLSTLELGYWLSAPLTWLLQKNVQLLRRHKTTNGSTSVQKQEFLSVVGEVIEDGLVDLEGREMIENLLEFKDLTVSDVMTPRTDMMCVNIEHGIDGVVEMVKRTQHSRVPIYKGNRDNVVGVFYAKDLITLSDFNLSHAPEENVGILQKLMRQPLFIPETKKISDLLREFRQQRVHFAVVLDEYSGTAGIITHEDILEEIFGEIVDEFDDDEPAPMLAVSEGVYEAEGRARIDEINEGMGIVIPDDENDTIGGYVFHCLGRIPTAGETVESDNYRIEVLEADERRVSKVRIALKQDEQPSNGSVATG